MSFNRLARLERLVFVSSEADCVLDDGLSACDAIIMDGGPDARSAASSLPHIYSLSARANDREIESFCRRLASTDAAGIFLRGCEAIADIQKLDVLMSVAETEAGLPHGRHAILADLGSTPATALLAPPCQPISGRLAAVVFDSARLAEALGLPDALTPDRPLPPPITLARAHAVLFAGAIHVPALVCIGDDIATEAAARAEGFSGVLLMR